MYVTACGEEGWLSERWLSVLVTACGEERWLSERLLNGLVTVKGPHTLSMWRGRVVM